MPVDRETGRPRGFAFVEFADPALAQEAIQRLNGQPFLGRSLSVSEARARDDRGPMGPPGPRPPRPMGFAPSAPAGGPVGGPRERTFGPPAAPRRAGGGAAKKGRGAERVPRGPIPIRSGGRSYALEDEEEVSVEPVDFDDFATRADEEEPGEE